MFNWAWVAQHTITSQLPPLTIRRPLHSLGLLFGHRRWLVAFLVGVAGWGFYIVAVRLAPLSLVQAVPAGGIALLAVFAQPALGERLPRREWLGVGVAVIGLVFLAASLAGGENHARHGSWIAVVGWFVACWIAVGVSIASPPSSASSSARPPSRARNAWPRPTPLPFTRRNGWPAEAPVPWLES
jgi:drug/metabolite transporter (DMT)-like permease